MYRHTRFQQKVSERRGWGGRGEERREGSMADQDQGGGRRKVELMMGKRKFGRVTHKLSFGEQLGILVEKEKEEDEEGKEEENGGEWSSTLERQDSELSAFSEMDLDEFYVEETPPEESEVEEEGIMEGFQEEKDEDDIFRAKVNRQEKFQEEAVMVSQNATKTVMRWTYTKTLTI